MTALFRAADAHKRSLSATFATLTTRVKGPGRSAARAANPTRCKHVRLHVCCLINDPPSPPAGRFRLVPAEQQPLLRPVCKRRGAHRKRKTAARSRRTSGEVPPAGDGTQIRGCNPGIDLSLQLFEQLVRGLPVKPRTTLISRQKSSTPHTNASQIPDNVSR